MKSSVIWHAGDKCKARAMKRTFGYILAVALILTLFFVVGRLLHKDEKPRVHPDTPTTLEHADGTVERGTYRELKNKPLPDGDRIIVGKRKSRSPQ